MRPDARPVPKAGRAKLPLSRKSRRRLPLKRSTIISASPSTWCYNALARAAIQKALPKLTAPITGPIGAEILEEVIDLILTELLGEKADNAFLEVEKLGKELLVFLSNTPTGSSIMSAQRDVLDLAQKDHTSGTDFGGAGLLPTVVLMYRIWITPTVEFPIEDIPIPSGP